MTKPTHTAYIVQNAPAGGDRKPRWTDIGTIWPHKNGAGFDLVIPKGLCVSGRIVCVAAKEPKTE